METIQVALAVTFMVVGVAGSTGFLIYLHLWLRTLQKEDLRTPQMQDILYKNRIIIVNNVIALSVFSSTLTLTFFYDFDLPWLFVGTLSSFL